MPGNQISNSKKPYLRIVGGNLCQKVDKSTNGARFREYELPGGGSGSKWELVYVNWTGVIENITFKDSDYGETCTIELGDAFIVLNTASRYFQDFACRLFSGDIKKPFLFHPYDMEADGRQKTGISLQQDGEKLQNYFYNGTKNLHGFPEPDEARKVKKSYWKIFFAEVAEFLIAKIEKLEFEKPEIEEDEEQTEQTGKELLEEVQKDTTPIDDLPF